MRNVNIHTFFRMEPEVPKTEHSRFWPRADRLLRQAGASAAERTKYIDACKKRLETDPEDVVLAWLKESLPPFSWKQELRDLPEFLFVYGGLLLGVYEHVIAPVMAGEPIQWQMTLSLGLLLQVGIVYIIYKLLLWVASGSQRGAGWWFGVIGLFVLYLLAIYGAGLLAGVGVFHVNLLVVLAILSVLAVVFRIPPAKEES